jgi:hypothetical protein
MADEVKLRFMGGEAHDVPLLARRVEPDDVVTIPKDLYESYGWSKELWSEVGSRTRRTVPKQENVPPPDTDATPGGGTDEEGDA